MVYRTRTRTRTQVFLQGYTRTPRIVPRAYRTELAEVPLRA